MDNSKILITGAKGQLGTALAGMYPGAQTVDIDELDITNRDSMLKYDWTKVRVVLNAAAYTNVDGAESTEGRVSAWRVNAGGPILLCEVATQFGITLLHISTDYVFDGTKESHTESETFSPLNVYGASKAAGDIAVALTPKHYILRTSWVIGEGKNFVRTMLDLGQKGINPSVVNDQIGRLTFTVELARAIDHLINDNAPYGTYNITNEGDAVSWADIARAVFEEAEMESKVTDVTTKDYYSGMDGIAPRPLNSKLDLIKIESTGFVARNWREELSNYVRKELAK